MDSIVPSRTYPRFATPSSTAEATNHVGILSHWRLVVTIVADQIVYLADSICIAWVRADDDALVFNEFYSLFRSMQFQLHSLDVCVAVRLVKSLRLMVGLAPPALNPIRESPTRCPQCVMVARGYS
ncbi:hypothetical protein MSAN_00997800 [Mycena sanguinolenta]|uniref:Uncharacterized protein n=1 Tax=Mycena sanguinolenta TaxID=230812 RepID=A0A8H6YRE3_9AGAR|nr:hypothetical protein MSAN_00997800 [Mycena sanguinolenta]